MENREAFTGISVETEESIEEVNWRQHNQRGRGNNRGNYHKQVTTPEGKVTKLVIVVVIAIQVNRQVTIIQYIR